MTSFSSFYPQPYFKDPWNAFDFITVVGSIVDRFGPGQPVVVSSLLSWEREKVNILRSIESSVHAR